MKELFNLISEYDTVIIHRHKRPDLDAIGSQMGLKSLIKLNFPLKKVLATGILGYEEFSYIGKVDYVSDNEFKDALCIIVDSANKDRIEDDRFTISKYIVKFDHHQIVESEQYGNLNIVDPNMSSTSEMVVNFGRSNNLDFDSNIAKYLFYGIHGDTGGFKFSNTSFKTFECISFLKSFDFDYESVMNKLNTNSLHLLRLFSHAITNVEIIKDVGYICFSNEDIYSNGYTNSDVSQVVNRLGEIKEINKWVVFNEYETFVRVNIRSRKAYDISKVAVLYNGGGHKNASGATIDSFELVDEIVNKLVNLKEEVYDN